MTEDEFGFEDIDETREEMKALREYELSEDVEEILEDYEKLESSRDRFLWKWVHSLAPSFTLPSVDSEHEEEVVDYKVIGTVFTTLLDDLVDKKGDMDTFRQAAKIPFDHKEVDYSKGDEDYLEITEQVWEAFESRVEGSPLHEEYEEWLDYDTEQVINSIRHSHLVNEDHEGSNFNETERFDSYNMMMFPYADIDLMHSTDFERAEMGAVRQVVDRTQRMARIGNWISTWEREIEEGDYTSGVVSRAIEDDVVTPEQLEKSQESEQAREEVIREIKEAEIEEELKQDWLQYRQEAYEEAQEVDSMEIEQYVEGMNEVMKYHLASRGMK